MTRGAVPHGPTSPLGDEQPHPGTSGYAERQIAAEGRAAGPTEGEIEAAAEALAKFDGLGPVFAGTRRYHARVRVALAAALPLIEARLREQIAGEIEGLPRAPFAQDRYARKLAAEFVRGQTSKETR